MHIERLGPLVGLAPEHAHVIDDPGRALDLFLDPRQLELKKVAVEVARLDAFQGVDGGHGDDVERLVQLVRHARGHLAQGGELGGLEQLRLRLFALGDVVEGHHRTDDRALAADRVRTILGGKATAVGAPQDLVVDVDALAPLERLQDPAFRFKVGGAVDPGVVD